MVTKAASSDNLVILLWHITGLLGDSYCTLLLLNHYLGFPAQVVGGVAFSERPSGQAVVTGIGNRNWSHVSPPRYLRLSAWHIDFIFFFPRLVDLHLLFLLAHALAVSAARVKGEQGTFLARKIRRCHFTQVRFQRLE